MATRTLVIVRVSLAVTLSRASLSAAAQGETPAASPTAAPEDSNTEQARRHFVRGVELVRAARWGEALASFEASAKIRPHPVTTFNIGACQRAMGAYTLARRTLRRAIGEQTAELRLPENLAADAQGFLAQIETTLSRVEITIVPAGAAISVDGRPLEREPGARGTPTWIAGVRRPGRGQVPSSATFDLVMDPGARVITLSRKGYADVVVNRSFSEGRQPELKLELAKLPATLRVSSTVPDALVRVNGSDLGPVPVDVRRPAGTHRVQVSKSGFDDYETVVTVSAGEQVDLNARLSVESVPLTKKWWFWTGAGVALVGGAFLTYALTRPEPEPPPYDGGNTGWVAQPKGLSF